MTNSLHTLSLKFVKQTITFILLIAGMTVVNRTLSRSFVEGELRTQFVLIGSKTFSKKLAAGLFASLQPLSKDDSRLLALPLDSFSTHLLAPCSHSSCDEMNGGLFSAVEFLPFCPARVLL